MRATVAAGQIYRSRRGHHVRVEQVRGLDGHGAWALCREVTRGGNPAHGDRGGIPRNVPLHVVLTWRDGVAHMPPGFEMEEA